jgi:hypothetical protein
MTLSATARASAEAYHSGLCLIQRLQEMVADTFFSLWAQDAAAIANKQTRTVTIGRAIFFVLTTLENIRFPSSIGP